MVLPDAAREVVETELRRLGACSPCVLRFLGTPAADAGAYRDACARDAAAASSSGEQATCPCCLGILQFDPDPAKVDASDEDGQAPRVDVDGGGGGGAKPSGSSSAREDADDDVPPRRSPRLASHYAAGMRSAGHEIATFALEVTLPPSIPMRQAATRALLVEALRGVSAENAFSSPPATTELRDAFRATLVPALEATAIDRVTNRVRHDPNAPFKFALLFEHERCRSEAGFATRKAEEHGNRDGRNRKRRAPPPQLQLATLPDSPAATWQRVGAAYNISEKRAAEAFTTVASFEADEYASRAMAAVRGEESRDESRESRKTRRPRDVSSFPLACALLPGRSVPEVEARRPAVALVRGRRRGGRGERADEPGDVRCEGVQVARVPSEQRRARGHGRAHARRRQAFHFGSARPEATGRVCGGIRTTRDGIVFGRR
jgi:hypothetical protein